MDKIFVPVNVSNSHWCMAVIYVQQKVSELSGFMLRSVAFSISNAPPLCGLSGWLRISI